VNRKARKIGIRLFARRTKVGKHREASDAQKQQRRRDATKIKGDITAHTRFELKAENKTLCKFFFLLPNGY
jgi:hypothetical protein